MDFRLYEAGDIFKLTDCDIITEDRIEPGKVWSVYVDNRLVACGGFAALWPGVYELWFHPQEVFKQHPIAIFKKSLEITNHLLSLPMTQRIHTQLSVELDTRDHLMGLLGFQKEGRLRKYIDGKDYDLYARIK